MTSFWRRGPAVHLKVLAIGTLFGLAAYGVIKLLEHISKIWIGAPI